MERNGNCLYKGISFVSILKTFQENTRAKTGI